MFDILIFVSLAAVFLYLISQGFKILATLGKWFFGIIFIFFGLVFLFNTLSIIDWPIWLLVRDVVQWFSLSHIWGVWDSIILDVLVWSIRVFWPLFLLYIGIVLIKNFK
ncbi:MAG: hypothetical protein Q7S21_00750 [archaeon]|nr:hypothetical protein [archaeon]